MELPGQESRQLDSQQGNPSTYPAVHINGLMPAGPLWAENRRYSSRSNGDKIGAQRPEPRGWLSSAEELEGSPEVDLVRRTSPTDQEIPAPDGNPRLSYGRSRTGQPSDQSKTASHGFGSRGHNQVFLDGEPSICVPTIAFLDLPGSRGRPVSRDDSPVSRHATNSRLEETFDWPVGPGNIQAIPRFDFPPPGKATYTTIHAVHWQQHLFLAIVLFGHSCCVWWPVWVFLFGWRWCLEFCRQTVHWYSSTISCRTTGRMHWPCHIGMHWRCLVYGQQPRKHFTSTCSI